MTNLLDVIKASLFGALSEDQIKAITQVGEEKTFEPGEEIFKRGGKAKAAYVLLEGYLTLRFTTEDEMDLTAEKIREPGSVLGAAALMKPHVYNVTAKCAERTRVWAMDGEKLRKIITQNCACGLEVMTELARHYSRRLNNTREAITNLFKIYKSQTSKSEVFDTYGELD